MTTAESPSPSKAELEAWTKLVGAHVKSRWEQKAKVSMIVAEVTALGVPVAHAHAVTRKVVDAHVSAEFWDVVGDVWCWAIAPGFVIFLITEFFLAISGEDTAWTSVLSEMFQTTEWWVLLLISLPPFFWLLRLLVAISDLSTVSQRFSDTSEVQSN